MILIFSKAEQKRLTSYFDEKEFSTMMDLSLQKVIEFEERILRALFEEDLVELRFDEENRR